MVSHTHTHTNAHTHTLTTFVGCVVLCIHKDVVLVVAVPCSFLDTVMNVNVQVKQLQRTGLQRTHHESTQPAVAAVVVNRHRPIVITHGADGWRPHLWKRRHKRLVEAVEVAQQREEVVAESAQRVAVPRLHDARQKELARLKLAVVLASAHNLKRVGGGGGVVSMCV